MRNFADRVALIVDDSFELSSQNATAIAKATRTDVWTRVLFGVIPERRLQESFDRAFRDHTTSFAINAYDIKAAWERIAVEEARLLDEATAADREANPVKYCTETGRHVDDAGNTDVLLGGPGGREVIVPCPICRPQAHQQRMADLRQQFGIPEAKESDIVPPEVRQKVVSLMTEAVRMRSAPDVRTDAVAIVDRLASDLGVLTADARSESRRDEFQKGYSLLMRVKLRLLTEETGRGNIWRTKR